MGGTVGDPKVRLQLTPETLARGVAQSAPAKQVQERIQREVKGRLGGVLERIRR
jgi:hypothetical protein